MKSDKQLTDECFNAFIKARPEFQKTFGNKDLAMLWSQVGSYVQAGIEFAWDYLKESQALGDEEADKDTTYLNINTDNKFIVIPNGDKIIKYKKVE